MRSRCRRSRTGTGRHPRTSGGTGPRSLGACGRRGGPCGDSRRRSAAGCRWCRRCRGRRRRHRTGRSRRRPSGRATSARPPPGRTPPRGRSGCPSRPAHAVCSSSCPRSRVVVFCLAVRRSSVARRPSWKGRRRVTTPSGRWPSSRCLCSRHVGGWWSVAQRDASGDGDDPSGEKLGLTPLRGRGRGDATGEWARLVALLDDRTSSVKSLVCPRESATCGRGSTPPRRRRRSPRMRARRPPVRPSAPRAPPRRRPTGARTTT